MSESLFCPDWKQSFYSCVCVCRRSDRSRQEEFSLWERKESPVCCVLRFCLFFVKKTRHNMHLMQSDTPFTVTISKKNMKRERMRKEVQLSDSLKRWTNVVKKKSHFDVMTLCSFVHVAACSYDRCVKEAGRTAELFRSSTWGTHFDSHPSPTTTTRLIGNRKERDMRQENNSRPVIRHHEVRESAAVCSLIRSSC